MDADNGNAITKNDLTPVASPPESTECQPGDPARSPGVFSPDATENATETPPKKRGTRIGSRSILRPDYYKKPILTYAEAADRAGVTVGTIQKWLCRRINPLPKCAVRGPYRIDRMVLEQYLRGHLKPDRPKKEGTPS